MLLFQRKIINEPLFPLQYFKECPSHLLLLNLPTYLGLGNAKKMKPEKLFLINKNSESAVGNLTPGILSTVKPKVNKKLLSSLPFCIKITSVSLYFNPFVPNAPFLYPLNTSDVSRGSRKGALGMNWLSMLFTELGRPSGPYVFVCQLVRC